MPTIPQSLLTLFVFPTLVQLIFRCQSVLLFNVNFWIGLLTRLEIMAIVLTLRTWTNDVPGLYQAIQLRNGKEIKMNKLFNG